MSTDWLNLNPNDKYVKLFGKLSTFWLKNEYILFWLFIFTTIDPNVKYVKLLGKLSTCRLKQTPNVTCVKLFGNLSTDWLNLDPNVTCVKLFGNLSTDWLKKYPNTKCVKFFGKNVKLSSSTTKFLYFAKNFLFDDDMFISWLKYVPNVKCVTVSGKLYTRWLNIEIIFLLILSLNIIFLVPEGKFFNKKLKLTGKVNVFVSLL